MTKKPTKKQLQQFALNCAQNSGSYYNDERTFRKHFASLPARLRNQPDTRVFTDSELAFAGIGICRFFGVDDDDDLVCAEVGRILLAHSRPMK